MNATNIKPTTQADAWDQFVAAIEEEFPGETNTAARQAIMGTARKGGSVPLMVRNYAGTVRGLDALGRVNKAWRRWSEF